MRRRQSFSCILSLPLLLFEDPGSALKGGVKVCKRPLVNEVLGLLLTEFFPDPTHKGATPIQRVVKLIRHSAPPTSGAAAANSNIAFANAAAPSKPICET
jgi:hypothetical protein